MRTQEDILARIEEVKPNDMMGIEQQDLISHLDYAHAKPFLKEGTTEDEWSTFRQTSPTPKELMIDYMPFAWEKANNCRGLSAWRSLSHFRAWLWLDGNDTLAEKIMDYSDYGKPQLVEICQYLGLDPAQWDDGVRVNTDC